MRIKPSTFEIFYFGLTFWAVVAWCIPAFFAIFSIFTLGLILLLPTFWIYATAMLPGHIAAKLLGLPKLRLLVSIPIWLMISFAPAVIASHQSGLELSNVQRDDFSSEIPKGTSHLIFRNMLSDYIERKPDPLNNAPCDKLCQRYLVGNVVPKISVVATFTDHRPDIIVEYTMQRKTNCAKALKKTDDAANELVAAVMNGQCLVAITKSELGDGLVIMSEERETNRAIDRALWSYAEKETRTVSTRQQGKETVKYRQTSFVFSSIQAPFVVYLYGGLFTTVQGWGIAHSEKGVSQIPLEKFLQDKLGLDVAANPVGSGSQTDSKNSIAPPRNFELTEQDVREILSKGKEFPIDPLLIGPINSWASNAFSIKRKPTATEAQLLTELVVDLRITSLNGVAWGLGQHPEFAQTNLRPILKRLSQQFPTSVDNSAERLGNVLSRAEHLVLTDDDKAKLLSLFSNGVTENNKGLLGLLAKQPKLGVNVIRNELLNMSSRYRGYAIDAACLVEKVDYDSLAKPLRQNVNASPHESYAPTVFRTIVLQEGKDQAEEAIKNLRQDEFERLKSYGDKILEMGKAECI
jgi:hypothetical protein